MASVRALAPIKSGGKWLPPGSVLHGVGEVQVRAWGARVEVLQEDSASAPGTPETAAEPAAVPPPPPTLSAVPEAPGEPEGDEGSRVEQAAMAVDLLDEADFQANGRPKLGPLSDVLGFVPSEAELALALALRADEGL